MALRLGLMPLYRVFFIVGDGAASQPAVVVRMVVNVVVLLAFSVVLLAVAVVLLAIAVVLLSVAVGLLAIAIGLLAIVVVLLDAFASPAHQWPSIFNQRSDGVKRDDWNLQKYNLIIAGVKIKNVL